MFKTFKMSQNITYMKALLLNRCYQYSDPFGDLNTEFETLFSQQTVAETELMKA
jgi:hypothetical protein